jgi:hypothetical protein
MYLINGLYFKDRLFVPNQDELLGSYDELERYIDGYARLLLQEILGFQLFTDLDQFVLPEIINENILGNESGQIIAEGGENEIVLDFEPATFLMFKNGIFQSPTTDYTLSGSTVNLTTTLDTNDVIDFLGSSFTQSTGDSLILTPFAPQKWVDFVKGKTYTTNGTSYRWKGLIFPLGKKNVSLVAEFVYSKWVREQSSTMSGLGNVAVEGVNARNVSAVDNYVNAYNSFVELYQGETKGNYVSCRQFLKDNEADYPEAALPEFKYENQFGI